MANEEDECDSSSLFPVASQSDVTSFLDAQAAKITGLNSSISDDDDDDESSMDGSLLTRFAQIPSRTRQKSSLSHSCFASISSSNCSGDLTELKWLNTFKLKELKDNKNSNNQNQITKLTNELKTFNHENTSIDVHIFLAFYSKSNDQQMPWSLSLKQLYEYIQIHMKQITNKRGWKNLLKQTLITNPCFVQTKSRSVWTIDPYYRPLLTRAYSNRSPVQSKKIISTNENDGKQIRNMDNFPPKATVKTKALPRLYERLCEEKRDNEDIITPISDRKRPRSMSSLGYYQTVPDNDRNLLSPSSSWTTKLTKRPKVHSHDQSNIILKTSTLNKESTVITPCPSNDHMYLNPITKSNEFNDEDDECDSSSLINKTIILTRSQVTNRNNENEYLHRRKSSPPRKRLIPNTRINKKIIEQDLELLRKATINQHSIDQSRKIPNEDILDLSLSR